MDFKWRDDRMGAKIKPPSHPPNIFFSYHHYCLQGSTWDLPDKRAVWQGNKDSPFIPGTYHKKCQRWRNVNVERLTQTAFLTDAINTFKRLLYLHWLDKTWKSFFSGLKSTRNRLPWDKKHGHQSILAFIWKSQLNNNAVIFFKWQ